MKTVFFVTLLLGISTSFARDMIAYKILGESVKQKEDASELIEEFGKLEADEDYEVEIDLCVVYGDLDYDAEDDSLDLILASEGYSMELEGIYGDVGDHMFTVRSYPEGNYIGSFAGVFECE